jgi:hypothetical protein
MPPETPLAFGLHPNAEIGFKLREAETFCSSLVQLQPRESGGEAAWHALQGLCEAMADHASRLSAATAWVAGSQG